MIQKAVDRIWMITWPRDLQNCRIIWGRGQRSGTRCLRHGDENVQTTPGIGKPKCQVLNRKKVADFTCVNPDQLPFRARLSRGMLCSFPPSGKGPIRGKPQ